MRRLESGTTVHPGLALEAAALRQQLAVFKRKQLDPGSLAFRSDKRELGRGTLVVPHPAVICVSVYQRFWREPPPL